MVYQFSYVSSLDDAHDALFVNALNEWAWYIDLVPAETNPHDADYIVGWMSLTGGIGQTNGEAEFIPGKISFDYASDSNFYEVALHEIGHALGLAHDDTADAVMNTHDGSDTGHLTWQDLSAIQELYPEEWMYGWHEAIDWEYGWYWDEFSYWWYFDNGWWAGWWWCTGGWWYGWHGTPTWDYGWYQ